jgi:uncharacterized protein (UPF0297 family)
MDKTMMFSIKEIEEAYIHETLLEVYDALKERGYNPTNQLVGYLISGDPGYISSYKNSRNKICKLDRVEILEILVNGYMKDKK